MPPFPTATYILWPGMEPCTTPQRSCVVLEVAAVHAIPSLELRIVPEEPTATKERPSEKIALRVLVVPEARRVQVLPALGHVRIVPESPTATKIGLA